MCVASVYPSHKESCATGVNNPQHAPEIITIEAPTTGIARSNPENNSPSTNQLTDNNRYYEGYDWIVACNDALRYGLISQSCITLVTPDGNALNFQGKQVIEAALCPRGQGVIKMLEFICGPIPDNLESELTTACG